MQQKTQQNIRERRSLWPRPLMMHLSCAASMLHGQAPSFYEKSSIYGAHHAAQNIWLSCVEGVSRYQKTDIAYSRPERSVVWQKGQVSLMKIDAHKGVQNQGAVMLIPSMVNGPEILDLHEGYSFAEFLAGQGFDVYLLNWGAPQGEERGFDLNDYFVQRLLPAFHGIIEMNKSTVRPIVAGYCMGGLFAGALASHPQTRNLCKKALFLATPWDFSASREAMKSFYQAVEIFVQSNGVLPADIIQGVFAAQNITRFIDKFRNFVRLEKDRPDVASHFVAVEDWLNGGEDMAGGVAIDCFKGLYHENKTEQGLWNIGDYIVQPEDIEAPCLCVIPCNDTLVPYESAARLSERIVNVTSLKPDCGHIGLIAGRNAQKKIWPEIVQWMKG